MFKQRWFVILVVLLLSITLFSSTMYGESNNAKIPPEVMQRIENYFTINPQGNSNVLLITKKENIIHAENPQEITIPILVVNRLRNKKVLLKDVTITTNKSDTVIPIEMVLDDTFDLFSSNEQLFELLLENGVNKALLSKSYFNPEMVVSTDSINLLDGDSTSFSVKATYEVDGQIETTVVSSEITIASLPSNTYWYGGDGHVHTTWSPDVIGLPTIDARVKYAKDNGFKWLIITDHADGIKNNYQSYVSQCSQAQQTHGIPVGPGAEITSVKVAGDSGSEHMGDALGYYLKTTSTSVPTNKSLTPQGLINAINSHNSPYSYAIIAHPYGSYPWKDWNVTGFKGMELMSNEIKVSSSTITKWFSLLRSGLSGTISGSGFVVGIGNTDPHNFMAPGAAGFTWVYSTGYSSSSINPIYNGIKSGRASASGRKDLGFFTINSSQQGSVIRATSTDGLAFRITQKPVTGRKCTMISVLNRDNIVLKSWSNPTTTEVTWTIAPDSVDTFYVIKYDFTKTDGTDASHVYTNPIFVDRY